jgi:AhpD family alkylhydroperoxidase
MPHIPVLPPERASSQSNAVYDEFYRRMSFPAPPNFITTQGHSATAARGTWELVRNVLLNGEIARWKKEMIFVAISHDRHCNYCEAAHIACAACWGSTPA